MKKYPALPPMRCDAGCGECCTVVPCTEAEFDRITKYAEANGVQPIDQGLRCPFYQGGTCAVYPVRPFVCRLFGHVPAMTCCRGYNHNVTLEREVQITTDMKMPTRLLHEAIPGFDLEKLTSLTDAETRS